MHPEEACQELLVLVALAIDTVRVPYFFNAERLLSVQSLPLKEIEIAHPAAIDIVMAFKISTIAR